MSFVMDEPYILAAARYMERNPVKAGLAAEAGDCPWSSAAAHVAEGRWVLERTAGWVYAWGEYLPDWDDADVPSRLVRHERGGRPLG